MWFQFWWPWCSLKVTGKQELLQSFCCKVAWNNSNVPEGWLCKGDYCEEVLYGECGLFEHLLFLSFCCVHIYHQRFFFISGGFFFSWQPERRVALSSVRLPPKEYAAKPDYRENEKVEVRLLCTFCCLYKSPFCFCHEICVFVLILLKPKIINRLSEEEFDLGFMRTFSTTTS